MSYPVPKIYLGGKIVANGGTLDLNYLGFASTSTTTILSLTTSSFNRIVLGRAAITNTTRIDYSTGGVVTWATGLTDITAENYRIDYQTTIHLSINSTTSVSLPQTLAQDLSALEFYPVGIAATTGRLGSASNNIVTDATAARTLALVDSSKFIRFTNAGAVAVTVPTNAVVAFPIGTEITVINTGGANLTVAGGGVTINSALNPLVAQHDASTLKKVGTDEWDFY
jgi:hypothetical protein